MIDVTSQMINRVASLNSKSEQISYQMSTGKVIENGSDDSVLYAQILNIEDKIRKYDGLDKQVTKTVSQNNVADSSMDEIKSTIDSIKVEMLKALNSGIDLSARSAIATNLEGMRENLLTISNTTVDGEYIFSGSDTTQTTFTKDNDFSLNGKVDFGGDAILRKVAVEPNTYRERGVTAFDVLMYNADTAGKDEQLNFYENERIIDENGLEWKLNGAQDAIQQYDRNGALISPEVEITVSAHADGEPGHYTTGVVQTTVGSVDDSDTRLLEAKHNFFDDLNVVINALKGYETDTDPTSATFGEKTAGITEDEINTIMRNSLDKVSSQYDATNVGHAELGGRNRIFEIAHESISAKQVHYNILLQETDGADMAKLAMEIKSLEMTYQAFYSTVMKMNSMSLLHFMK